MSNNDRELIRRIWALAWPTVIYSFLELSLGLADLLMIRALGQDATAAIGLSRQITFFFEAAALAISTGVITLVSQGLGAGDRRQIEGVIQQSLRLVLLLGLPTTLVGYLASRPLLSFMQASAETVGHGGPYLQLYFLGIIFLWGNTISAAVFRGMGNVMTPLKLAIAVSLINIGLNYIFIFGIGPFTPFGVKGAAIGTVAARAIGTLGYLILLVRGKAGVRLIIRPVWDLNWKLIQRILRVGMPPAIASVLRNSARLVFLAIVGTSALGVSIHAAVGVGLQIRLVSVLPALAFQVATATLVGQAVGRGDFDEAEVIGKRSVLLLSILVATVVGLITVFARPLTGLFIADPETINIGVRVIRWFAIAQFFSALSICTQGVLTGAGYTKPIMRYTLLTQWGAMLTLAFVLLVILNWDPDGLLLAWSVAPVLQLALMQKLLWSGIWKVSRA